MLEFVKSRRFAVIIAAVIAVPSVCYLFARSSDAKIQFLVGLVAVGTCGYVLGWVQESPVAKREIALRSATIEGLEREIKHLKEMLTKALVENHISSKVHEARAESAAEQVVVQARERRLPKFWRRGANPPAPLSASSAEFDETERIEEPKSLERSG